MDTGQVFRAFKEGEGDGCIRIVRAFRQLRQKSCFNPLSTHESPRVCGDLVREKSLGFRCRVVGLPQTFAQFFVGGGIFARHDNLRSRQAMTRCVTAGDAFALH
jgi:hypothetical protein